MVRFRVKDRVMVMSRIAYVGIGLGRRLSIKEEVCATDAATADLIFAMLKSDC